jgi:O-antigen/teichoic acid export membrane protein
MGSLARNSLFMMGTTISSAGLGYLYWVVAARTFAPYDVGLAANLISVMTLASFLSTLGMGPALIHTLPRLKSGRPWSLALTSGLASVTVLGWVAGVVLVIALPLFLQQFSILAQQPLVAGLFVAGVAGTSLASVLDQAFVAERASANMLVRNIVFCALKLSLLFLPLLFMLTRTAGAQFILGSWVSATAATVALGFLALVPRLHRHYHPTLRGAMEQLRSMRRLLVGNHLISLGGTAPIYLIPVLVATRLSVAQSAFFYTTFMVAGAVFMISPSVATSLFAEGSRDSKQLWRQARSSVEISARLLLPAIAVFLVGGGLILSLFGPSYASSGRVLLSILVLSGIPDGITNIYVAILRVQGRVYSAATLNVGMAVLALSGTWLLLPVFGLAGAGLAWMGAQVVGSVASLADFALVQRGLHRPAAKRVRARVAASAQWWGAQGIAQWAALWGAQGRSGLAWMGARAASARAQALASTGQWSAQGRVDTASMRGRMVGGVASLANSILAQRDLHQPAAARTSARWVAIAERWGPRARAALAWMWARVVAGVLWASALVAAAAIRWAAPWDGEGIAAGEVEWLSPLDTTLVSGMSSQSLAQDGLAASAVGTARRERMLMAVVHAIIVDVLLLIVVLRLL